MLGVGAPDAVLEGHHSIMRDHEFCESVGPNEVGDRTAEVLVGDLTGPRARQSGVQGDLRTEDLVDQLS